MSTKTTFKRVALVAVAALGLGVLTNVSAQALTETISAGTSNPARVAVDSGKTTITVVSDASSGTKGLSAQISSAPATSTKAVLTFGSGTTSGTNVGLTAAAAGAVVGTNSVPSSTTSDVTATGIASTVVSHVSTNASQNVALTLNADVAGTYTVLVTWDSTTGYASGKKSTSYTITTAGIPTSIAVASVAGSAIGRGTNGVLLAMSLKDANGNATVLGRNEGIDLSTATATLTISDASIDVGNTPVAGVYYTAITGSSTTAAGTAVIKYASGGSLGSTLSSAISLTTVAGTATTTVTGIELDDATGYATVVAGTSAKSAGASHTFEITVSDTSTAARNFPVEVSFNSVSYSTYATVAALGTTGTVTVAAALTSTSGALVVTAKTTTAVYTLSYEKPAAKTISVVQPTTGITSELKATNKVTAEVLDQYGDAVAGTAVTVAVTGRNTKAAGTAVGVTDADGLVTYTLTDAGTAGTSDSLVFSIPLPASSSAFVITYGTVTVTTVSFTGGSTTKSVANATVTTHAIEADDTPESATQTATVTVTDVNKAPLAGVAVTFTVSGSGAAITTTTATQYTDSTGVAVGKVFAWLAGTYTVTATAGGVSSTGSYTFASSDPASARVLSAKAEGGLVTATVVDRFGNPVSGVTVYATKSGSGYFGAGLTKTSSTTGTDGTVDFAFVGSGDVTVKTLNYADPAGTNASGQTCALAGNRTCASGATAAKAFTATTAGTTLADAKNVGSSYAPAGVSSVSVAVSNDSASAAADAAAEATDAANAATDAANAAAEAADAATAAAQDAADAVAALSTQVSEMVNALKKQITALTNLVIKIQKKVKA